MFRYAATLSTDDNGTILVQFPDVPEAISFGEDEADALARGREALETALGAYIVDRRDIPAPAGKPARGQRTVAVGLLAELKLSVYQAMRARGWRKADLARALAINPRQADRLFDLSHATPVRDLEAALAVCGRGFEVSVAARAA